MAATMLKNGILPDSTTLASAGISQADAAAYVQAVQQAAMRSAKKSTSGGTSKSTGSGKPNMTYAQIVSAIENGQITDSVKRGYDYYMGSGSFDQFYGSNASTGGTGMNSSYFNAMGKSLAAALEQGKSDNIEGALDGVWGQLSEGQRAQIQSLLNRYGISYLP